MVLRASILLFLLLPFLQKGYSQDFVRKGFAYSKTINVGNYPADGTAASQLKYFIYLQTDTNAVFSVRNVWLDKKLYSATLTKLEDKSVFVGRDRSGKEVNVKAANSSKLYFIQIQKAHTQSNVPDKFRKLKTGMMLLEIVSAGKRFYYTIPVMDLGVDLSVG